MGNRTERYRKYRKAVWAATNEHSPPRFDLTRDHIVPVSFGFTHGIPPELIGSPENIEYVDLNTNIEKGTRIVSRALDIMDAWGLRYPEIADLAEALRMRHENNLYVPACSW